LFGKAFLVAPVTEPNVSECSVYLPKSVTWYDFWTGKRFNGGQTIKTAAPLEKIPLFIKAGSILPIGPKVQYATEKSWDNLEIRVYEGADGNFILYEDENDNYNYEKGHYSTITFSWDDSKKILTINNLQGSFNGMLSERTFRIVKVVLGNGIGTDTTKTFDKVVSYKGKKITVEL
jgi:alpha-D-xyloside xylohydrolase